MFKYISIKYFSEVIRIGLNTPYFFIIIILNFISSFMIILGIPLLIPALQFLQNNDDQSEIKFIQVLKTIFEFLNININFFSVVFVASLLIFIGQLIILLIELFSKKIHINLNKKYMNELIDKYYQSSWSWMITDKSGKFQSAISREINAASETHLDSLRFITNFFQLLVYIISALIISIYGSFYSILFFISALLINLLFSSKLKNISSNNNKANIRLLSLINSLILNKKFLKSSKNFDNFSGYIKNEIFNVNDSSWKLALVDGGLRTFTYLFGLAFMIGIFIFHEYLTITFNEIIILLLIFSRLIPTSTQAISNFNRIIEKIPIYESINKRIYDLELNKEIIGTKKPEFDKVMKFSNVDFFYNEDENVLKKINLLIEPLKTTVIIGESGSGKSTFLDLFMGLLKLKKGEIFLGDQNFKNINLDLFRKNIAYVSQDTSLLDGSINFNLKIVNKDITEEEIYKLAKKVKIDQFIKKLPLKLDTNIGENGIRLSGGQKQRIAILRALVSSPKILVLDEATSNLDLETEKLIMETIENLKSNLTILIVTHRFTFLNNVDRIFLIQNGEIKKIEHDNYIFQNKILNKKND